MGVALLAVLALVLPAGQASADVDRPVVLIGVPGLQWSDAAIMGEALGPLLGTGDLATASLVVRSTDAVACPVDGWLAISAGNRASGPGEEGCTPGEPPNGAVPGWDDYLALAADRSFAAEPGLLGDTLAQAGISTAAIGPGAAVALATSSGEIAAYQPYDSTGDAVTSALAEADLVVVDVGDTRLGPLSGMTRQAAVAELADELATLVSVAESSGRDPVILVSGISDAAGDQAASLRLFATIGLGGGELTSPSTRQPGYVLATDQHATILDLLGVDPGETSSIGAPMTLIGSAAPAAELIAAAVDRERHAGAQRPLVPGFFLGLVLLNLLLYGAVALGLRRPSVTVRVSRHREPVLRALRVVALGVAAIPVASYLTNLLPWWRADPPVLALLGGTLAFDAAVVALALRGPWRRTLLGPAAVVAAVTAVVLAVDVVTGARLQVSAIMGIPTLVAGRFYGMNNTSFALFAASSILLATAIANRLVLRGRRGRAAVVVAGIGVVAIVIDGAPFWGADFGGPPALLVAFGLLTLLAAGVRLTVKRVVAVVVAAGAAAMAIAFLDWLRPAESRTHLGRFFADVLDGELWPVIGRKLDQNLTILLGNRPLTILAICGVLLVVFVLIRPVRQTITAPDGGEYAWLSNGAPISAMAPEVPMLGPGLIALATAAGIGFAVNDSGIAIPALSVAIAVPLLLASCATWMLTRPETEPADQAERDSPSSDASSSASASTSGSGAPSGPASPAPGAPSGSTAARSPSGSDGTAEESATGWRRNRRAATAAITSRS